MVETLDTRRVNAERRTFLQENDHIVIAAIAELKQATAEQILDHMNLGVAYYKQMVLHLRNHPEIRSEWAPRKPREQTRVKLYSLLSDQE